MTFGWIAIYTALALLLILPMFWLFLFAAHYRRSSNDPIPLPAKVPRVAVLLPLRGSDPMLEACLDGILRQDYPDYAVYIVVDSANDPAMEVVQSLLARRHPRVPVHVDVLREHGERCSLKMSAQLQMLGQLNDEIEIVAFLDADSVTRPDWLRSMIGPFRDPKVGATSGVRWYTPPDGSFGSLVRHFFNIGGLGPMYKFHIPWGGSQAVRFSFIHESNLLSFWGQCFAEDTSINRILRADGLRLEFVPAATNFNSESSSVSGVFRFVQRQVISARLHADSWPVMLVSNASYFLAGWFCWACLFVGMATQTWQMAVGATILLVAHGLGCYVLVQTVEGLVRQRESPPPPTHFGWRFFPAAVVMHAISTLH